MKLRDLDAKFVGELNPATNGFRELGDSIAGAQGVLFQCPHCAAGKATGADDATHHYIEGDHYILCWFSNPNNAPAVPDSVYPGPGRWTYSGTGIDDLTLSPSVDLSKGDPTDGIKPDPACMWHGHVTNGDAA